VQFYSRSHQAVIRVYDEASSVIETHEHTGEFNEWQASLPSCSLLADVPLWSTATSYEL